MDRFFQTNHTDPAVLGHELKQAYLQCYNQFIGKEVTVDGRRAELTEIFQPTGARLPVNGTIIVKPYAFRYRFQFLDNDEGEESDGEAQDIDFGYGHCRLGCEKLLTSPEMIPHLRTHFVLTPNFFTPERIKVFVSSPLELFEKYHLDPIYEQFKELQDRNSSDYVAYDEDTSMWKRAILLSLRLSDSACPLYHVQYITPETEPRRAWIPATHVSTFFRCIFPSCDSFIPHCDPYTHIRMHEGEEGDIFDEFL